jgi:hypothetical protein
MRGDYRETAADKQVRTSHETQTPPIPSDKSLDQFDEHPFEIPGSQLGFLGSQLVRVGLEIFTGLDPDTLAQRNVFAATTAKRLVRQIQVWVLKVTANDLFGHHGERSAFGMPVDLRNAVE